MTREDLKRFCALDIDFESIGLMEPGLSLEPYFCTPMNAEPVGRLGCDGIHFVLLPGDERVFCVDPAMGEPGTYVLPVATDPDPYISGCFWTKLYRFCQRFCSFRTPDPEFFQNCRDHPVHLPLSRRLRMGIPATVWKARNIRFTSPVPVQQLGKLRRMLPGTGNWIICRPVPMTL